MIDNNKDITFYAIAVDLDGTLLDDEKRIPEDFNNVINGERTTVVFVTGRNDRDAHLITKQISAYTNELYIVYEDGQYIAKVDKNDHYTIIKQLPYLDEDSLAPFLEYTRENRINYSVYTTNGIFEVSNQKETRIKNWIKGLVKQRGRMITNVLYAPTLNKFNKMEIIKIVVNGTSDYLNRIISDLNNFDFQKRAYYVLNDERFEMKAITTNKLCAMLYLIKSLNVPERNCMYVGNGGNDVDCLKHFEYSYCVSNAVDEAKNAAKKIVPSNNELGAIIAIKEFIKEISWDGEVE